jgi:hypothetical protein
VCGAPFKGLYRNATALSQVDQSNSCAWAGVIAFEKAVHIPKRQPHSVIFEVSG